MVSEAANQGANFITLPECFNSPYGTGNITKMMQCNFNNHFLITCLHIRLVCRVC